MVSNALAKSIKQTYVLFFIASREWAASYRSAAVPAIEQFFLKPNWKEGKALVSSIKCEIQAARTDISNLSN